VVEAALGGAQVIGSKRAHFWEMKENKEKIAKERRNDRQEENRNRKKHNFC